MNDINEIILEPLKKLKHTDVLALHEPDLKGKELSYVSDCINSGWVSSVGSYVDLFESKIAEFVGVPKAVAVVNGTAALHLALLLMGVKSGDEVLTPALSFVATTNAIAYVGAIPHFVDSGESNLAVCPELLNEYLEAIVVRKNNFSYNKLTNRRISALIVMHALGHSARIQELKNVAERFNIKLVEDAAEALGSYNKDQHLGTIADIGVFSFNGNKIMTTGNGGALVSHDIELMKRAKHISTTAKASSEGFFYHDEIGYNYRLSNINAALGVAQLERMPEFIRLKNLLASYYQSYFSKFNNIHFVTPEENTRSNYWLSAIQLIGIEESQLMNIIKFMHGQGIMLRPLWVLNNELPMYQSAPSMNLKNAKAHVLKTLCLPSSAHLANFV